MTHAMFGRAVTAKTIILAAFTALNLGAIGSAHSQPSTYHAPSHNYYQNNWMAGGGG